VAKKKEHFMAEIIFKELSYAIVGAAQGDKETRGQGDRVNGEWGAIYDEERTSSSVSAVHS